MFGNLIEGSQNTVWQLALEGEIPQNYENRSIKVITHGALAWFVQCYLDQFHPNSGTQSIVVETPGPEKHML